MILVEVLVVLAVVVVLIVIVVLVVIVFIVVAAVIVVLGLKMGNFILYWVRKLYAHLYQPSHYRSFFMTS